MMIQDIYPNIFSNNYLPKTPDDESNILYFNDQEVMVKTASDGICFPAYKDFDQSGITFIYLFNVDDADFFLALSDKNPQISGFGFESINIFRGAAPKHKAFAGITAYHLSRWYHGNQFCGGCKTRLEYDHAERMLFCQKCGNKIYPKICPVVIAAVTDGDRLLMTKYAHRGYQKYALVAGFIEIGETAEDAVKREVMEETGIKVKDIKYYKSQPWGFSESLLFGFFAQLDGNPGITIDKNELSEAVWVHRDKIQAESDELSLTNEMICHFKTNGYIM